MRSILSEPETGVWNQIEPLLDEALRCLGKKEHDALVLRFFDGKELKQVGAAMGTTEDAARMRVRRSLEKLRKFFTRKGVVLSTASIAAAVAANSVQAAPAGLAATITAGALSGTTFTTAAVITATKSIAMTTLQKTVITTAIAVALGTGIYQARQSANARAEVQRLRQQSLPSTQQIQQLQHERDEIARQLASLREENEKLKTNADEILRLRSEVTRLRAQETGGSMDPVESAARIWINRVSQLKQRLTQSPQAAIPELQLLTEEDWLAAVKGQPLETDTDYRRALSTLRRAAESKAVTLMQKALLQYASANNGQFPSDLYQLQTYSTVPLDAAIIDRWKIADKSAVPNVGVGNIIVTQKAPVDDVFDERLVFGLNGEGETDFLTEQIGAVMNPVFEAYRTAHNGQWQTQFSQLLPYASTPEQQAALQKLMLKSSSQRQN